jgi:DNA topoisomerase-1
MIDNLVIVESPAKAKTIEKFLGKEFRVVSSFGHIRDLAKKNGINVEKDFAPDYEIPKEKAKVVSELRKAAAEAKEIWIASDEDREGEAIAWHLATVLKLDLATTKRIVFHEITKEAITDAIKHPRSIDMNLVNSQQARRILDRLVGFEISPVLWKKVQPSLSAGRVQSVAVRLIVEREREIISFNSESSFRVTGEFAKEAGDKDKKSIIKAEATKRFPNDNDARKFLELCCNALYTVGGVTVKPGTRSPAPPFTTSTLQQEAYRKLGFSVSQTMAVAQKLYEAGKITYMRTDSTNLSKLALAKSREIIISEFGEKYSKTRQFKTRSKGAQEAHEAIRPAYPDNESVAGSNNEKKLYELIWKRTIASQMADAEIEKTTITVDMNNSSVQFSATGEVIKFDGFLKVYMESTDQETGDDERYVKIGRASCRERVCAYV